MEQTHSSALDIDGKNGGLIVLFICNQIQNNQRSIADRKANSIRLMLDDHSLDSDSEFLELWDAKLSSVAREISQLRLSILSAVLLQFIIGCMIKQLARLTRVCRPGPPKGFFSKDKPEFTLTEEDMKQIRQLLESKVDADSFSKNSNITVEQVFQTREQLLSFKLMNCTDLDAVFALYEKEVSTPTAAPLNANELSLFVYFTACLRSEDYAEKMRKQEPVFFSIVDQCLHSIQQLEPQSFSALLWGISTFRIEVGHLNLNDAKQYLISQKAVQVLELLEPESLPTFAFSVKNVLRDSNELVLQISKLAARNINSILPASLVMLISSLPVNSLTNSKPLFDHISEQFEAGLLSQDQFIQVIIDFVRITGNQKGEYLLQMLELLDKSLDGKIKQSLEITGMRIVDLIVALTAIGGTEFVKYIRQLLKLAHAKAERLNINEYVGLWLALPKILKQVSRTINLEKTVTILIMMSQKSQIFTMEDLTQTEIIQIIAASAALRLDNKEFLGHLLRHIDIQKLSKEDLLILAQCFVIYVRQFESEYLRIHQECCNRRALLTEVEKAQLLVPFNRVRILIPNSPFFN